LIAAGKRYQVTFPLGIGKSRIVNFKVRPKTVTPGEEVRISGNLQGYTPIIGWGPMKNNKIQLVINGQVVEETTTGDAGDFYFHWYPREVNTYWIKAQFPGTVLVGPSQTLEVAVKAITEEERRKREQQFWIMVGILGLVGVGAVVGVADYLRRQRMMAMLLAAS